MRILNICNLVIDEKVAVTQNNFCSSHFQELLSHLIIFKTFNLVLEIFIWLDI